MNRFVLIALLVFTATLSVDATIGSIDAIKAKLRNRYPNVNRRTVFGSGGAGSAASASSSASATGYGLGTGGYYGSGSAAAAAAASAASSAGSASGVGAGAPMGYNSYDFAEPIVAPVQQRYGGVLYGNEGSAAAASAAASAGVAVQQQQQQFIPPPPPAKPMINLDTYRAPIMNSYRQNQVPLTRFAPAKPAVYGVGAGAASSASSAASAGVGGMYGGSAGAASSAAAGAGSGLGGSVAGGQTYSAAAGTYADSGNGRESSAYRRSTENIQNHEDGHVDDNHYYNAQSYGKTDDEKMHEAYNNNNEDIEQSPTLYRSKKSGENYVMDYAKARRESGSGVLASDKHSSAFNKNSKRLVENVDQTHSREGNGIIEDTNVVSAQDLSDADEEIYDSDGFNGGYAAGGIGAGSSAAAASAAGSAGGRFGGAASSSAAAAGARRY